MGGNKCYYWLDQLLKIFVRISEWQHRYHARDSKPEDLETIKELKMIVREQEQKMRELIVSHFC